MTGYGPQRQDNAVIREWRNAMDDGAHDLAKRIEEANPDLFEVTAFGAVPKKRS